MSDIEVAGIEMTSRFGHGDLVRVKSIYPPGHIRTPYFIRGHKGRVVEILGHFHNPESLAYGRDGRPDQTLYRIVFDQADLWPDYDGVSNDDLIADIYEHWLEPLDEHA